jgi:hypothetical protein
MFVKVPVEVWSTRFGTSVRVVVRGSDGRFVNNKSAKQMIRVQDRDNGVKYVKKG